MRSLALAVFVALAACAVPRADLAASPPRATPAQAHTPPAPIRVLSASAARGQALASSRCASCHATGQTGDSPLAPAPAFRDLQRRYPVEDLAEALAEGIDTAHPGMPEFVFEPAQITDFIAYLKTLKDGLGRPVEGVRP